jgi:hypothetical protein
MNAQNKKRSRSKSPNGRRLYSRDSRSRSRSPARRSPYKRRSPNVPSNRNIKRYRSKSPNNNQPVRSSKASSEKESLHKNRNNSRRNNLWRNDNGNKFDRRRSESDNDEEDSIQSSQKSSQSERENNDKQRNETVVDTKEGASSIIEKNESPITIVHDKSQQQQAASQEATREKTQDELEDELLASDDDLAIDIGMDENELDFLNDDSESENEGRFKDKPSLSTNKQSSNKSSSKEHEDLKAYNKSTQRNDKYKRKEFENRSNLFYKKSLRNEENKKPLFKSTFKSVESEKTNGEF